jgi:hypothetical protein
VRQVVGLKFYFDAEKPTSAAASRDTRWPVKIVIDAQPVVFYYRHNTGKEVIKKYMSSNHSEVAES